MKARVKATGEIVDVYKYYNVLAMETVFKEFTGSYRPDELDFNVETSEEVVITRWLTRSKYGNLTASDSPECKRGHCVWYHKEGSDVINLDETGLFDNNIFPNVTWESEPLEVTITIKPKSNESKN